MWEGCYKCKVDGAMGKCAYAAARCRAKREGLRYCSNFVATQATRSVGGYARTSAPSR